MNYKEYFLSELQTNGPETEKFNKVAEQQTNKQLRVSSVHKQSERFRKYYAQYGNQYLPIENRVQQCVSFPS